MNLNILSYTVYLVLSIGMTIWVARTLSKNGLPFLVDVFEGNRELAGSVNHLLVVGFYLVNLGYAVSSVSAPAVSWPSGRTPRTSSPRRSRISTSSSVSSSPVCVPRAWA